MSCDIIIPVFNQAKFTQECIDSIKKCTHTLYRIIIIDDNSRDLKMIEFLDTIKGNNIKIIRNKINLGWVKSVNRGLAESGSEYVCVMNNDTIVTEDWLSEMIRVAESHPDIGLVNPEWEKPNRISIQAYAEKLKVFNSQYIETDWVRGFCFLIKREVLDKIKGFDEAYSPGYFDDWDFSVRAIKAGFRCVRAKAAYVYHWRNITYKNTSKQKFLDNLMERNKRLFYQRWGKPLRIVFTFNKRVSDKKRMEEFLFSLAKDQHHIYIWSINKKILQAPHTNVRMSLFPQFLFDIFLIMNLINNFGRNMNKRYNIIFVSDRKIFNLLSKFGLNKKIKVVLINFNASLNQRQITDQIDIIKHKQRITADSIR